MFRFLQSIFAGETAAQPHYDDRLIEAATERVIDGTDSRLRMIPGYKRKLRTAVVRAIDYVVNLVDVLDPPVALTRTAFAEDPRIRALFVSPEHIDQTLQASQNVVRFSSAGIDSTQGLFGLLIALWEERQVFGIELVGDLVQRDVPQVAVAFTGQRLSVVAGSEAEARWEIKKNAFDHLVRAALGRLVAQRVQRQELEREHTLLARKLKQMEGAHLGLGLEVQAQEPVPDLAAIEARLGELEQALLALRADSATLDDHLEGIVATLEACEEHVSLSRVSFVMDRHNIKRPLPDGDTVRTYAYQQARAGGQQGIVQLVTFPRPVMDAGGDRWAEAERYLR
jgi:hypothetical protein